MASEDAASHKKQKTEGAFHAELQAFIDRVNEGYEKVHREFEEQFWGTKMALKQAPAGQTSNEADGDFYTTQKLSTTKAAMEEFLRDPALLKETKDWVATGSGDAEQLKCLGVFERTFSCYQMNDPQAVELRNKCTEIEDALSEARNKMKLGYQDPNTGEFVAKSSVGLRTTMKTSDDEKVREAAWNGLRSIGPFIVSNGFVDMVKMRNAMARKLGYEDFYDYKVTQAEGFGKKRLFQILDTLLDGSKELLAEAMAELERQKGASALQPWNAGYMMSGDIEKQLDPYFPFEKSIENWGRSYAKLGIGYRGATMTLDLLDRQHKYSNGFCHWPQPAWRKHTAPGQEANATWQPSTTNFTSLADPAAIGSGKTALVTLMHEAGHAAHFANIVQPSPLFSQERAPTSVAYAENQSMFLDSLVKDAAWRAKYARNRQGEPLPWHLHEAEVRATHPFEVFMLRSMLCVPYFEKALYELADDEVTAENIQAIADRVEREIQGCLAARPMLSVPHIISDEASCYYHGYVLAEMSVYQTRAFFLSQGPIVDNPAVGKALTEAYWQPGNSAMFLDLVEGLTGKPLTGEAWIDALKCDIEAKVAKEKHDYDAAIANLDPASETETKADGGVDLDMHILIKDGDDLIADSSQAGGFLGTCRTFEEYVQGRFLSAST